MTAARTAVVGALIVALGPLSMALYTPAMPTIVTDLETTASTVKLTLTVFFFGFAFAQLVCGPLSDAYGRRPVAIWFFSVYLLGSLIAALAPGIGWLLVGRVLQGVGVAAGVAISRAIVRDQFTGQSSARIMNLIALMLAVGPALAPVVGGVMLTTFGWQSIFFVLVLYGTVVVVYLWLGVPETNLAPDTELARPSRMLTSYKAVLRDRSFMRGSLVLGLALGGTFTMAALVPFVLMDGVGLTPTQFGFAMLAQTGAFTLGSAVTGRLLRQFDSGRLIPIGLGCVLAAGVGLALAPHLLTLSTASVLGPAALWAFGVAVVLPGATTRALAGFGAIAGAASAMTGFLQVGGGLAGTAVAAVLFPNPLLALSTVLPGMAFAAMMTHVVLGPGRVRASC